MAESTNQARCDDDSSWALGMAMTVPITARAGVSEVEGNWMDPVMKAGDLIRYDYALQPKTGDIVIARTACGMNFMGNYAKGYCHGEFVIRPERGAPANSLRDPIEVVAVVTHHLRTFRH